MNNTVDNKVRHVTSPDVNIFAELGFAEAKAKSLKHDAECEVEQLIRLKQQLMQEISGWIDENHLKQAEAAVKLNISRPRVSDVVNQKTNKFTLDALVMMLVKLGKPVTVQIG
ncbi:MULTISPECIES: helix-turn-helix domain-containing protein [Citrobacter]|uniref:XRE family transcriptional regulator n=1 Tax=Citrobacter portucalensis TaxID=1639133 RepID=A0AAW5WAB0_9ENTR|nr:MULTISPECIES: XRE family transcriptional regulator [Citrobacter]MCW8354044.1 XRE family transcriptional regulator [Citrobacter portucalensis]MCX9003102.1 XRE family transcriptional regulator [Citrobacter portucalensis]MCX9044904.1 XRE family transcriptional regulator [Citrobacter portucalensis]MCX9053422.1 XRE family transcriptional regulator [Citrobacter portucalensis]MCX9058878.1 XRE family transcriptional regulator [Citrobacter portucalensis]